jgi:hypothetical protein
VGSVSHTGKLNIYGAPFIRKMDPIKVVAGKSMAVTCPVAGYPISRIVWERGIIVFCPLSETTMFIR